MAGNFKSDNERSEAARNEIKYELAAYLNQLGAFYHFICSQDVTQPVDPDLKETWYDLHKNGVLHFMDNKWSGHRSVDCPKKEDSDSVHTQIMFLMLVQLLGMASTLW